jgi:hypothetical protein
MSTQDTLALGAAAPGALRFDDADHRYFIDEVEWPGVTRALEDARLIDFSKVPRDVLERAKQRGTAVHSAVHYWLEGDLDEGSLTDETHGYLMAAGAFLNQMRVTPLRIERFIQAPAYRFCGRLDLEGLIERKDGKSDKLVVDWKSGLIQPAHRVQLAGYVSGLPDPRSYRRMTVELHADGSYKIFEYSPEDYLRDLNVLHAAVALWHWKRDQGLNNRPEPLYSYAI